MKTLLQRLLLREPDMNDTIVHQAVREWLAAYKQEHLQGCEGQVLEQEQDWCNWLQAHAPRKFQAYLLGTGRLSPSVQTIRGWWKPWIEDNFIRLSLVEEWREDWNRRKA
jgi:hypothetical protein